MNVKLTGLALAGLVVMVLGLSSVAIASGGMTGTYTTIIKSPAEVKGKPALGTYTTTIKSPAEVKGKWAVTLGNAGTYVVALNGKAMARGNYSATGTTITFREPEGCGGSGTYAWKLSGKLMTFTLRREAASCQARKAVLTHRFTQVR